MRGTISITAVKALPQGAALWDQSLRGFGVRRQGATAVYIVKYRIHGRQRMLTIGAHGPLTPELARRKAKQLLGHVAAGADPAEAKAEAALQASDTLRKIVDRYLVHAKAKQRPNYFRETSRYLLIDWAPLHRMSVFHIKRRHVADRLTELSPEHPVAATRSRAALSACFEWAIREGYEIEANPVRGTNRPAGVTRRRRVLSSDELRAIWLACGDDDYGRIVRLLILTAQRRGEVGGIRWSEIGADGLWSLPASRTKNRRDHIVPLPRAALALLPPRRNTTDLVFRPRASGGSWSGSKATLDARCGVAQWRLHDLRRSVATRIAELGVVAPHIIEALLNHTSGHKAGVAGIYNLALYIEPMRDALRAWSREVARIVRPRTVTLRRVVAAERTS